MEIKYVKFFTTGVPEYQTYFVNDKVLQNDGETSDFTSAEDAVAKSTKEVFIFWDGMAIGAGAQEA